MKLNFLLTGIICFVTTFEICLTAPPRPPDPGITLENQLLTRKRLPARPISPIKRLELKIRHFKPLGLFPSLADIDRMSHQIFRGKFAPRPRPPPDRLYKPKSEAQPSSSFAHRTGPAFVGRQTTTVGPETLKNANSYATIRNSDDDGAKANISEETISGMSHQKIEPLNLGSLERFSRNVTRMFEEGLKKFQASIQHRLETNDVFGWANVSQKVEHFLTTFKLPTNMTTPGFSNNNTKIPFLLPDPGMVIRNLLAPLHPHHQLTKLMALHGNVTAKIKTDLDSSLSTLKDLGKNLTQKVNDDLQQLHNSTTELTSQLLVDPLIKFFDPYNWTGSSMQQLQEFKANFEELKEVLKNIDLESKEVQMLMRTAPKLIPQILDIQRKKLDDMFFVGSKFSLTDLASIHDSLYNVELFLHKTKEELDETRAPVATELLNVTSAKNMKMMTLVLKLMLKAEAETDKKVIITHHELKEIRQNLVNPLEVVQILKDALLNCMEKEECNRH